MPMVEDRAERGGPWLVKLAVGRINLCSRQMALTEHRHQLGSEIRGALYFGKASGQTLFFLPDSCS